MKIGWNYMDWGKANMQALLQMEKILKWSLSLYLSHNFLTIQIPNQHLHTTYLTIITSRLNYK